MSTSFQELPPPPPIGMAYPTTTTETSGDQQVSSKHSSGSFVMVFVVLAIILFVSAVACVLGRFCTKKSNKNKPHKQKHNHNHVHHNDLKNKHNKGNHKHGGPPRPKERDMEFGYRSKEGDIMLGFDQKVKIPSSKVANYNNNNKNNNNGDFRGDNFGNSRGMEHHGGGGNYVHGMHNFKGDHHSFGSGRGMDHGGNFNMPRDYP